MKLVVGEIDLHQMADNIPRERDVEFDLESGGNTSEEDASNDVYVSDRESKGGFHWTWNGILGFDGSYNREGGVESCSNSAKPGGGGGGVVVVDDDNLELLVDKGFEHAQDQVSHVDGNHVKQKTKPGNPRKPSKPPLPPKGPSLDAGDQKFVNELAELALRKRARIKRMKAVRKMKASKSASSSSSYTNLSAMVITIFFFLVIILHGKSAVLLLGLSSIICNCSFLVLHVLASQIGAGLYVYSFVLNRAAKLSPYNTELSISFMTETDILFFSC